MDIKLDYIILKGDLRMEFVKQGGKKSKMKFHCHKAVFLHPHNTCFSICLCSPASTFRIYARDFMTQ